MYSYRDFSNKNSSEINQKLTKTVFFCAIKYWQIFKNLMNFNDRDQWRKHTIKWTHILKSSCDEIMSDDDRFFIIDISEWLDKIQNCFLWNKTMDSSRIYLFIYSFIRNHTKRSHILPFIHHPLPSQTPPQHPACLYILSSASSMCENFIAHYMLEHDEMTDDLLGPKKRLGCGHFYLHAVAACQLFFSSRTGNNTGSLN